MSIADGQRVRALESNAAWASKTSNNTLTGVQTLSNGGSGASIANVQQEINDQAADIATAQNDIVNLQSDVATLQALDTFIYVGAWNASTNSPTLADGDGGATYGVGAVYRVSVAGTQNLGSGSQTFAVGDKVVYNTLAIWEKWDVIDSDITLDQLQDVDTTGVAQRNLLYKSATFWEDLDPNEVSTNAALTGANQTVPATDAFFKLVRLTNAGLTSVEAIGFTYNQQKLILVNATGNPFDIKNNSAGTPTNGIITGTGADLTLETDQTLILIYDSTSARWRIIGGTGTGGGEWNKENLTLNGTDITNQYKDLAFEVIPSSLDLHVSGVLAIEGIDYTLSTVSLVTRITFAGQLATGGNAALISGNILNCKYQK